MWSDSLLAAERTHLVRLLWWGGASLVVGLALLAVVWHRRHGAPLLLHFAIQTAAWGAIDLVLAGLAWRALKPRDHAGFTTLDRILWLNIGLDVGYVGVGVTLIGCGLALGRRMAPVGAGLGVVVQGAALIVLDLVFLVVLGRIAGR